MLLRSTQRFPIVKTHKLSAILLHSGELNSCLLLTTTSLAELHGHDDPEHKGGEEDEEHQEEEEVEPVTHQGDGHWEY